MLRLIASAPTSAVLMPPECTITHQNECEAAIHIGILPALAEELLIKFELIQIAFLLSERWYTLDANPLIPDFSSVVRIRPINPFIRKVL
jgi:hypothetical protein